MQNSWGAFESEGARDEEEDMARTSANGLETVAGDQENDENEGEMGSGMMKMDENRGW